MSHGIVRRNVRRKKLSDARSLQMAYKVHLELGSGTDSGHFVPCVWRTYSDFVSLKDHLSHMHDRVSKFSFPDRSVMSDGDAASALHAFMQQLFRDQDLLESPELQRFMGVRQPFTMLVTQAKTQPVNGKVKDTIFDVRVVRDTDLKGKQPHIVSHTYDDFDVLRATLVKDATWGTWIQSLEFPTQRTGVFGGFDDPLMISKMLGEWLGLVVDNHALMMNGAIGQFLAIGACAEFKLSTELSANMYSVTGAGANHGSTRSVSCSAGFMVVQGKAPQTVTCSMGTWSDMGLRCEVGCSGLVLENSLVSDCDGAGAKVGGKCTVSCALGFLGNTSEMTCSADRKWTGSMPVCKEACPALQNLPEHISTDCSSKATVIGGKCSIRCATGYVGGTAERSCGAGAKWSTAPLPTCEPAQCRSLPMFGANYVVTGTGTAHGSVVTLKCAAGTLVTAGVENEVVKCQFGEWSAKTLVCGETCDPMVGLPAGVSTHCTDKTAVGTACIFSCEHDYDGNYTQMTCESGNKWNGFFPHCTQHCVALHLTDDHAVDIDSCTEGEQPEGTACNVGCPAELAGNASQRVCKAGSWTGESPKCVVSCPPLASMGVSVKDEDHCTLGSVPQGTSCELTCAEGYGGAPTEMQCVAGKTELTAEWQGAAPRCASTKAPCTGEWCGQKKLAEGDCCNADDDCSADLKCHAGHRVCTKLCNSHADCPNEPASLVLGKPHAECDGYDKNGQVKLCAMETVCTAGADNVCETTHKEYTGPVKELCGPMPNITVAEPVVCQGKFCGSGLLKAGDCCTNDADCEESTLCNMHHRVCEPACSDESTCPAEPKALMLGQTHKECDGYHSDKRSVQLCSMETACEAGGKDLCQELLPTYTGPAKDMCATTGVVPKAAEAPCLGEYCAKQLLEAGDCCSKDHDCKDGLFCNEGHRVCTPQCQSNTECAAEPKSMLEGLTPTAECDGYNDQQTKLCAMESACVAGGPDICEALKPTYVGPVKEAGACPLVVVPEPEPEPQPETAAAHPMGCIGPFCDQHKLDSGDCCTTDADCKESLKCHVGHRVCEPACGEHDHCPPEPKGKTAECDGYNGRLKLCRMESSCTDGGPDICEALHPTYTGPIKGVCENPPPAAAAAPPAEMPALPAGSLTSTKPRAVTSDSLMIDSSETTDEIKNAQKDQATAAVAAAQANAPAAAAPNAAEVAAATAAPTEAATDAPTDAVTDAPTEEEEEDAEETEAPTEAEAKVTEAPTEAEAKATEAPTEAEAKATEAPTQAETEAQPPTGAL